MRQNNQQMSIWKISQKLELSEKDFNGAIIKMINKQL